MVRLKFRGKKLADLDFWTKSDPFLVLSRPNRDDLGWIQLRQTETIMNNLNPEWKILYIPMGELCDNNPEMPLLISVFDYDSDGKHDLIGTVELTLAEMKSLAETSSPARILNVEKKAGKLYVMECKVEQAQDLERKGSVGCYPARRGSAYSLSQDEVHHQECLMHQAKAQELLSQGIDHSPHFQDHHQDIPIVSDDTVDSSHWTLPPCCPYPTQLHLPEEAVDRRPSYS